MCNSEQCDGINIRIWPSHMEPLSFRMLRGVTNGLRKVPLPGNLRLMTSLPNRIHLVALYGITVAYALLTITDSG